MDLIGFPLDFVRQVIEQTMFEEHLKNPKYFGGDGQVYLLPFYEELVKEENVDRYVETLRDLIDQQNRTGLIMLGTVLADENPTITNLAQDFIIPLSFTCSFRVPLKDKNEAVKTINHLIEKLKGRKQDIAEFEDGQLLKVGTIGNSYEDNGIVIKNGDYLGEYSHYNIQLSVENKLAELTSLGVTQQTGLSWVYASDTSTGEMSVLVKEDGAWKLVVDDKTYKDIIFPPSDKAFEKYKISMSFDSVRVDTPKDLNSEKYCEVSFGGSATIVNCDVALGNDLVKLAVKRDYLVTVTNNTETHSAISDSVHWLEPLELPSGNNADTQMSQLIANKFKSIPHTDSISVSNQYTFMLDKGESIIKAWFLYGRYGVVADGTTGHEYANGISPNMVYAITEWWSYWGNVEPISFNSKLVGSVDIDNTESDALTIKLPMQVVGA